MINNCQKLKLFLPVAVFFFFSLMTETLEEAHMNHQDSYSSCVQVADLLKQIKSDFKSLMVFKSNQIHQFYLYGPKSHWDI